MKRIILILTILLLSGQTIYANELKAKIRTCLIQNIYKHKQIYHWDKQKINTATEILYIAEKHYKIEVNDIIATISLESHFNPQAIGINKNSFDYGLTQQNSKYFIKRYLFSMKILDKYNIKYDSADIFDIGLNLMSCVLFKYTINKLVNRRKTYLYSKRVERIVAYNLGVGGARMRSRTKLGYRYYRIYKRRMKFCSVI